MQTRRDILRAVAASAAAMALGPAMAQPPKRVVSPFLDKDLNAGLGLWTRHAAPDARLPLPGRVHAVALHPDVSSCVAVARRPGRFGLSVDLDTFEKTVAFESTPGRHFFGHGSFIDDGRFFLTTENDYEAGRGVIGVRDAHQEFRWVGEWQTGGVGPHDLALSADNRTLFVANGGFDTSPDYGRALLNERGIRSSLAIIDGGSGRRMDSVSLEEHPSLSIRHLAVLANGDLAFGCHDTLHDSAERPLVGILDTAKTVRWLAPPAQGWRSLARSIGEVSADETGRIIAATSPLGSLCAVWEAETGRCLGTVAIADGCAIGALPSAFVVAGGGGTMLHTDGQSTETILQTTLGFDNHLIVA